MGKWIGLDKIVEAVYESDIELLPPETRENQKMQIMRLFEYI